MTIYRLHRKAQTADLAGDWIGANVNGMSSEDGVFEFVFVPVEATDRICTFHNRIGATTGAHSDYCGTGYRWSDTHQCVMVDVVRIPKEDS